MPSAFIASPSWETARPAQTASSRRSAGASTAGEIDSTITPAAGPPESTERDDALDALGELADHAEGATDLFVNGAAGLWADYGQGAERVEGWALGDEAVRALAVRLIAHGGRHIDEATPAVDVRLGGGVRVHAVLPPLSTRGTLISVRIPRSGHGTLADLHGAGMFDDRVHDVLIHAVERRENILISGAAGAGKTTLLAALLGCASPTDRIVVIEDLAELQIRHPHVVSLEARQPNLEGAGGVRLDSLVREALRMRPDRLVVGECRGAELRELLSALNTGHDGGAGTVHANSLDDVPTRLEALGALAGLGAAALARQTVSAFDLVVHVERHASGRRIGGLGRFALVGDRLSVMPL
ncbi:TadA family conjugal transfer-associated ATPase [Agromyces atrinae]|uniref:TadA family conjugal transfer-associated ATPase n=1 Tax=Agromyces atrinae TaxID=592376 RepID=UPI001F575BFC|nr:TadA family conjugal transfer-associated ATPase [Agromyces atrinae]MCI2959664.1 TadA family conjugal transfer-associated ATPase [Agromyces atrinae]